MNKKILQEQNPATGFNKKITKSLTRKLSLPLLLLGGAASARPNSFSSSRYRKGAFVAQSNSSQYVYSNGPFAGFSKSASQSSGGNQSGLKEGNVKASDAKTSVKNQKVSNFLHENRFLVQDSDPSQNVVKNAKISGDIYKRFAASCSSVTNYSTAGLTCSVDCPGIIAIERTNNTALTYAGIARIEFIDVSSSGSATARLHNAADGVIVDELHLNQWRILGGGGVAANGIVEACKGSGSSDDTPPAAPGTPVLDTASDSGSSDSDNITNVTTPTITGTAEADSTVTLTSSVGDAEIGTGTTDGNGDWSITTNALTEGVHTLTATATDAANNTSDASTGLTVTIDTTGPTFDSFNPLDDATGVAADSNFVITYSENVVESTGGIVLAIGETPVFELQGNDSSGVVNVSGTTLTINPDGDLAAGDYYFIIQDTAVLDIAGNDGPVLSNPTDYDFTVIGGDTTAVQGTVSVSELDTTAFGSSNAVDVLDFTITNPSGDGGGFQMDSVALSLSGTASDNFTKLRFSFRGCGTASDVTPAANTDPTTVTFSGLSHPVNDDGTSSTCIVSAWWADSSGITDNQTVNISMDADTNISISGATNSGGFAASTALTTGDMSTEVTASKLVFAEQPTHNVR